MNRDNTPWQGAPAAALDWSGEQASEPRSTAFADVYYSRDCGLEESRHVFVQGNNLPQRWLEHSPDQFCIAETGFGTGLNFLLTWQTWLDTPPPRPRLHYISVEKFPLGTDELRRALSAWPELAGLSDSLLLSYPERIPGQHRRLFADGQICLDLWWEDVLDFLPDLASHGSGFVDAWYLDGFAPARNAEMWHARLFRSAAQASHPQATFATFTAAGQVRRDLQSAGFEVEKVPGHGRKRECLRGRLLSAPAGESLRYTPWDLPACRASAPSHATVLGAGLAGCMVAHALATRGIQVTVLERDTLAAGGSGNDQGILYTRLSRKHSALNDFALLSFGFAADFYRALFHSGVLEEGIDGSLCGSFHQSENSEEMATLEKALADLPRLAEVVNSARASELLGVEQPEAGYWFPGSGWLRPAAICRALLRHQHIALQEQTGDVALTHSDGLWRATARNQVLAESRCVIVATGESARNQPELSWLPSQAIRGQTTQLPALPELAGLNSALCHEGYIAPAQAGEHCIGATFDLHDSACEVRARDHQRNIDALAKAVPVWSEALAKLDTRKLAGRVAFRCASPDYLPAVGPVPALEEFLQCFAGLRKNARQFIPQRGPNVPGLFVTTCHGSRGLSSTPLAAELLASQICNEAPPLSRELIRALSPARFPIRDLRRNRQ